jgi:AsmA protein
MKKPAKSFIVKALKISGITVTVLLLLMLLLPIVFPGKVAEQVKLFANEKLEGDLDFSEADLSFFNHFPSLTLTLKDFKLKGSAPYKKETLLSANEMSFGINLKALVFNGKVKIDKIFVSDALINVKVNEKGEANYNVYISEDTQKTEETTNTSLKLEKIAIENTHLVYNDKSAKILIDARGFNYIGKGNLDQAIFDIATEAQIDSLDFTFDGQPYLKSKKVNADLITKINTNSLAFIFEQNNLKINKLPVEFTGKFDFLKNGYDMDFAIASKDSRLNDFFTALPPQYVTWLEKTKVRGSTDIALTLKGKYIASENKKPDLAFNMKIREGEIEYKDAPFPVSSIYMNFDTKLPALDTEQLRVNLDSLYFNVGKDYLKAIVKSKGLENPDVDATIKASMDLGKLDQAFGIPNLDLKGLLSIDVKSKGKYDKAKRIFPVTKGAISLKEATVKSNYYPNPITGINLSAAISNGNGQFSDSKVTIDNASFVFEGKPFFAKASFVNFDDVAYNVKAKGEIDVAKVYQVFSKKGLDLKGLIKADVAFAGKQSDATSGNYAKLKNSGTLQLINIRANSEYFPKPFVINQGLFKFREDKMDFSNFRASYGQSNFTMDGYMQNVINYALSGSETLKGQFSVAADYINIDEFMSGVSQAPTETEAGAETPASGVIVVPDRLDLQLAMHAKKVNFNGLAIENAQGKLGINHRQLTLENTGFGLIGCNVLMNAAYASESATRAHFDFQVIAKDFDIKRAYDEVKLFREMATAAENAQGVVSLVYKVSGKLGDNMQPIYPSLLGGGTLSVKNVKLRGFKMFGAVSKQTNNPGIENPDVSRVDIHTSIANNIIKVERFKFKFAGFRPRIEGTTSFDGNLNIKMRLGLPPLGIIGIPMTITGTKDDPKIKLGSKTEDLQETPFTEQTKAATVPAEPVKTETATPSLAP